MKISRSLRKILIRGSILIVSIVILVIIFISPITKWLIEKYDFKYTNREIYMDWAYVNPFTGYVHFENLSIKESKSDSDFIAMNGISINFSIWKLFKKEYEITHLNLSNPRIKISQKDKIFNFADIVNKFKNPNDTIVKEIEKARPVFSCNDINIENGTFYYEDERIPVNYFIKKVNISSPGYSTISDTLRTKFSFHSGPGSGIVKGVYNMNFISKEYFLDLNISKFDLTTFEQYIKDITKYGNFSANLDLEGNIKGNLMDAQKMDAKGNLAINAFHFGKTKAEDFLSFKKLYIQIKQLNPKAKKYIFDSVILNSPYAKYEKYDEMDNIRQMFKDEGKGLKAKSANTASTNILFTIAKYFRALSKNFFKSNYEIDKIKITDANFKYLDYSFREKMEVALNPFNLVAEDVDRKKGRMNVKVKSGIKPYGNLTCNLSLNPNSMGDFDFNYNLTGVPLSILNPIIVSLTTYPMDRGVVEFKGNMKVRDSNVNSLNHLILVDPRLGTKIKKKDSKWIPMPLIMGFVRENGNVIDYEIPITGTLKNPKFKFKDVIWDVLTNIVIKPVTIPYRVDVKSVERNLERIISLKWEERQVELYPSQRRFLKKIASFLEENPKAKVQIQPFPYTEKEMESILFFEAKKRYYIAKNGLKSFSSRDSSNVIKIQNKDTFFISYLNRLIKNKEIYTVQDKCELVLGKKLILQKYAELVRNRQANFLNYFNEKGIKGRFVFVNPKYEIPFNGASYYKLAYNGKLPESVLEAYKDLQDYNDEDPRKEYQDIRKKQGFFRRLFSRKSSN